MKLQSETIWVIGIIDKQTILSVSLQNYSTLSVRSPSISTAS